MKFARSFWLPLLIVVAGVLSGCQKADTGIHTLADASTSRMGVMTGTTGEMLAARQFPKADIKHFDDILDAISALKAGQVDSVLTAYPTILLTTQRNPDLTYLPDVLSVEDTSIGVAKDHPELRQQLDDAITQLKSDGTLEDMKRRWFKTEAGPYAVVDIPVPTTGIPLRIGIINTREPVSFLDPTGQLIGHDIELARRIGQLLHRPLVFTAMRQPALIPALAGGKIDAIITGMSATPERRERIDFTQRYYEIKQYLMVRKSASSVAQKPSFVDRTISSFQSNILKERRYLLLLDGLRATVLISILSALLGTALGAAICYLRLSRSALLRGPAIVFIDVLRGTPVLVLLMLIFYGVFASVDISPLLVSVVAFGLNFGAYSAEIFRTGIEGVDRGQTEAGVSLGFTRGQTFRHIVLPQMIQKILPVYKGEFISLVKMTSVVGYVAVQDLTKASDIIRSRTFDAFFPLIMVAILYFLISWVFIKLIGLIELKTDPRRRRQRETQP
jgi:polar amino acid transport system substrate-binding protein